MLPLKWRTVSELVTIYLANTKLEGGGEEWGVRSSLPLLNL